MTQQSKLEWTEYKSRFRATTAYGTYWVDMHAGSTSYKLICGPNPCYVMFSSPQEAKDCAQMIHDRPSSRDDWFNLSEIEQAPYHAPLDLSELMQTYETLLAGDNLPERIAVHTADLRTLLDAADHYQHLNADKYTHASITFYTDAPPKFRLHNSKPVEAADGSMTPEEIRLENLKQMAKYDGPIISFECRDPYYLASCDCCGWVGSSELCGTDSFGDDSDVYCPRCHSSGADCGKVAELVTAKPVDAVKRGLAGFRDGLEAAANYHNSESDYYGTRHGDKDGVPFPIVSGWHKLDAQRIRALSPTEQVEQWQDITTAPKDGTWIIAIRPECAFGQWDRVVIVCWHDDFKKWIWPDDTFDVYKDDINETDDDGRYKHDPYQSLDFTHWMPLPPAPTIKGGV